MTVDPALATVAVALVGAVPALLTLWAGRRQRAADLAKAAEERRADQAKRDREAEVQAQETIERVLRTVHTAYEELMESQQANVTIANARARSAEESARSAADEARAARADAWEAGQRAKEMARFLVELRPLILQYVPGAADYVARLDALAVPPSVRAIPMER
jgi:FtsZ-interacting cell division protein ZipA